MRLLKAYDTFLCFLFSALIASANDGTADRQKLSQEELSIVSMLDSLTGNIYGDRFRVQLQTNIDTAAAAPPSFPLFKDSIVLKTILAIQSEMPLKYNERVKRYIEVYGIEKRAKAQMILGLSEVYFPLLEEELDRRNLPHHLK